MDENFLVRSASALLQVIPEAFRIAGSGRLGPVLIDVPKDVQAQVVKFEKWPEPGLPDPAPDIHATDLERAAEMINQAHRPILYLGGGVIQSDAGPLALRLAEKASIPVAMTLMGLGAMAADHPLSLGMLGMHAARYTNLALEECDLLIAAGVRFDDRATGKVAAFCPNARIIHIDIDPSEFHKIKKAHLAILGDVGKVLDLLMPLVEADPREDWLAQVAGLRREYPLPNPGAEDIHSPYGLIMQAAGLLDSRAVIVTDVGQHQMWTAQVYPFQHPRQWLTSGGLGTMGFGLPAAIGAALACPDRTVVCFSGDGSLMMNIQELATAVEQGANLKIILMNNRSLGLVHQQQELFYNKRIYASDYQRPVDFLSIAAGFGVKAYDLAAVNDPKAILSNAFSEKGPCLIHALIDIKEMVFPMVPPGAANREMIGGDARVRTCA